MMQPQLDEKNFIQEPKNGGGLTTATWTLVFIGVVAFGMLIVNSMKEELFVKKESTPFLNVTNRDFSLFLWQNFNYMRMYHKDNVGYLSGFESNKPGIREGEADNLVQAPPEILFLYHTWNRQIKKESVLGEVSGKELIDFLQANPAWNADNWKQAPTPYKELVQSELLKDQKNVSSRLPLDVAIAVHGWKIFTHDEKAFNAYRPTVDEFHALVKKHPHFSPNYWINITPYVTAKEGEIPLSQLPLFLRLALFSASEK